MRAMVLMQLCNLKENPTPFQLMDLPDPVPTADDILVQEFSLAEANRALTELQTKSVRGAKVLRMG